MKIISFPHQNGPWKILDRKLAYDGKYAKVYEDEVIRPDNQKGIHLYIPAKDGVSILPYDQEGNVYLVEIFRYAHEKYLIEIAGGGIDEGEDLEKAASRELKEETGIIGKNYELVAMTSSKSEIYSAKNYIYICEIDGFENSSKEGTENIEVLKLRLSEAILMVNKLEIIESATIIALLKLKEKINL